MKKEDLMFYLAYIMLFILLGVWMLIWALTDLCIGCAFVFWLLCAGVIMMVMGTIKTKRKPHGESTLIIGGMLLSIISLVILAFIFDIISVWVTVAIAIILIGIGGLAYFMSRVKGTIED